MQNNFSSENFVVY
jgi:PX domain